MPLGIDLSPRVFRDLRALEKKTVREILGALEVLQNRPWPPPPKVKKLAGQKNPYRLRIRNYRAIFEPMEEKIAVLRVMDRKELERSLKNL